MLGTSGVNLKVSAMHGFLRAGRQDRVKRFTMYQDMGFLAQYYQAIESKKMHGLPGISGVHQCIRVAM